MRARRSSGFPIGKSRSSLLMNDEYHVAGRPVPSTPRPRRSVGAIPPTSDSDGLISSEFRLWGNLGDRSNALNLDQETRPADVGLGDFQAFQFGELTEQAAQ